MRLLAAGVRLGSYEIVELVGRGGMGEVYKALDIVLRRHAALKVLPAGGDDYEERVQRFLREARAASALNHPNIVTIYDAGSIAITPGATTHYIAMEFLDGSTLRPKMGRTPIEELLPVFVQVADALAKAHEAGVVHRDLKPENVLVRPDGVAKIVDFGLAKSFTAAAMDPSQFETHEGVLLGTFAYMSPEQTRGGRVDGRSDMFAFGSMLFEALTGTLPFLGDSALETLQRIAHHAPQWPGGVTADRLQEIAERCLAKHPDDRYPTMSDVAAALRAARTGEVPSARPRPREPAAELSPAAREVVNVAAVNGTTVSIRELRDLFDDHNILEDGLDELVAGGILVEQDVRRGTFSFASASECEAFYKRIPRRRRKEIHSACAAQGERLLGARPATAGLLRHFQAAGTAAKVVEYGLPLLRHLERVQPAEAIHVAEIVVEAAGDDLGSLLEATELLARAHVQLGDFDRALARIDELRPLLEASPDALTRLSRTAAQVAWEARRVDVAERWIRRGLSGSGQADDAAPVRDILALAAKIATVTGNTASADAYALRLSREDARPSAKAEMRGGRIVVPSMRSLPEIDPSKTDQLWQSEIVSSIFETLTRVAVDGRIVPWLARFEANADSTAFRFRLREDLRFHNGRTVTSGDVAFTYARFLRQHTNTSRWSLAPIRGAHAVADGATDVLEGFHCHSDREFTIELTGPVAVFPAIASFAGAGVIPAETGAMSGTWRETCVGTGPYRVARFEPNRRLELEANPFYWRDGLPRTGRLAFVMGLSSSEILERFRSRELTLARDLSDGDFWSLRRDAELRAQYAESPRLSTYFLVANRRRGAFADRTLRKEVFGIDVEAVLRASQSPLIHRAHTLSPPGLIGHVRSPANTSQPSKTALFPKIPVKLGVLSGFLLNHRAVVERLVQALTTRGLVVEMVEIDQMNRTPARLEALDLAAGRWYADYPDADSFNDTLLHSHRGIYGQLCGDPKLDEIIERARAETDPRIRRDDYAEIEELLQQEAILLPLFHESAYCFAQPEVGGFDVNFSYPAVSYEQLWL
ncbi:MAG TPA: ABC transporter substrate-binding protein [Thermoanaerobaculia bacterium]|nr:ABC transporter substrate-binding protein [Thermoanaerobaculia bacterium]